MKFSIFFITFFIIYISCANKSSNEMLEQQNSTKPILVEKGWYNQENRKQLIKAIKNCSSSGLFAEDYDLKNILLFESVFAKLSLKEKEKYFNLLSESFKKIASHLSIGKLNPKEIYPDWEIKRLKIKKDSLLLVALDSLDIKTVLANCEPQIPIYKNLKLALKNINTLPTDTHKEIHTKIKFKKGDQNKTIISIKKRLQYWKDLSKLDSLTDKYDENLEKAIKQFQERHGLQADGVIGTGTLMALNIKKELRKQQIICNLERWRWFPKQLGINHLVVNIPNYKLHTVQNIDTTLTFKVVVGTEKRKTPILSSKVSEVIFNPTWTVPPTIIKEDLIPETRKSRKYISSRNIVIYNRKGKEVNLADWHHSVAEDYRYVQKPGEDNALGFVKINFPNNHMVYLHDTNHRELFVKNYRALSSGCVRVENPLRLAEYLLYNKPENYNTTKIDSLITFKETNIIKLDEEFQVHILYFTAWLENNLMQFRDDVYSYDTELYLRLSNQFTSDIVTTGGVINK